MVWREKESDSERKRQTDRERGERMSFISSSSIIVINCGLGLWRFVEFTRRPEQFWVFVVLAIIVFLFEVTMATYHFISKYVLSHLSKPASNLPPADVELRATVQDVPDSDSDKSAAPKKKSPSKVSVEILVKCL